MVLNNCTSSGTFLELRKTSNLWSLQVNITLPRDADLLKSVDIYSGDGLEMAGHLVVTHEEENLHGVC